MNVTEREIVHALTSGIFVLGEIERPGYMLHGRNIKVAKGLQNGCNMKVFRNPEREGVMQCEYLVLGRDAAAFATAGWIELWINDYNEFVEA